MNAGYRGKLQHDCVILVLQGGGALGAYQAGVFEGMTDAGYLPHWITGVSMGAINGALIAGNPPNPIGAAAMRVHERLRVLSGGSA